MAYIKRAITDVLKSRVSSSKCLFLTGARQVGKSTLIKREFPEFHRADFDDRLTRLQAREEPKLFFLNNPRPPLPPDGVSELLPISRHIFERVCTLSLSGTDPGCRPSPARRPGRRRSGW